MRVDELQTILAAEIKSRNISERELEQQIMSARENSNQHEGGSGGENVSTAFAKKLGELSDKLHHNEALLQMESTERSELQRQVTAITSHESTVSSQIKKLEAGLEKGQFLNKVAADERKRQMELIREAESKIVESNDKLAEAEHKQKELQRESRNHIEFLEKKLEDQAQAFEQIIQEQSNHVEQVAASMRTSQEKAAHAMEGRIKEFEGKVRTMEENMHTALSDGLRSLHNDLRLDRENCQASQLEMKEVLSAEITSRRKAVGKTNASIDKLTVKQEDLIKSLQALKAHADENIKDINSSLCKIASGFSEQLITLQEVTKTAVRTLQIDQVSLTAKLKNSVTEYKQLHQLHEDRADECDKNISTVEESIKTQSKRLRSRIGDVEDKLEVKSDELCNLIEMESNKREGGVRKLTDLIASSSENCLSRVQDLATEVEVKVNEEATDRDNAISSSEKRLQKLIGKQGDQFDEKLSILKETVANEISYAITTENQTRVTNSQKVSKALRTQMKLLEEKTNELLMAEAKSRSDDWDKTLTALQELEQTISAQSHNMGDKHTDFVETIRIAFEENDMNAKQAKCRLNRRLARQSKHFANSDENVRQLITINQESCERNFEKLASGLASSDTRLVDEIQNVNTVIERCNKEVLLEVDKKEMELLERLKVELMQQLLASHVKSQAYRQRVAERLRGVEVKSCLDRIVNTVVDNSVSEAIATKFDDVQKATVSDTQEAKSYVDVATKFLDKKLMAGFDDYNKRLSQGLNDVRGEVNVAHEEIKEQVEKNDAVLLNHLKEIHTKSNERRLRLEENMRKVEVGSCLDRVVSSIVESSKDSAMTNPNDGVFDRKERKKITAEIDMKINAVGIEVLDRVQKVQNRQTELEETLQSYDLPVVIDKVRTIRQDVDDAVEETQSIKNELNMKFSGVVNS